MALSVPIDAGVLAVDTSTSKTILIPLANEKIGRILIIKDRTGQAATNPIILQLQGSDTFENGTTTYSLAENFGVVTIISRSSQWLFQQNAEEVRTSSITFVDSTGFKINANEISTGFVQVSTVNLLDPFTNILNYLTVSSATLLLNGSFITGQGGTAVTQIIAGSNISVSPPGGTGAVTINGTGPNTNDLISTVEGLGTLGYISTSDLLNVVSTPFLNTTLASTVQGLGTAGYVSTQSLVSTTSSLIHDYGIGLSSLSTAIFNAPFTYAGQNLYLNLSKVVPPYNALETFTANPIGSTIVTSIPGNTSNVLVRGFQTNFILPAFIPGGFWEARIFALASGTGVGIFSELYDRNVASNTEEIIVTTSSAQTFVDTGATPSVYATFFKVPFWTISTGHTLVYKLYANNTTAVARNLTTFYEDGNTYSYLITTFGGTAGFDIAGFFSSFSTSIELGIDMRFNSTIQGLGSSGYVSTLSLYSTVAGLGSAGYVSTASLSGLVSTPNLLDLVSTPNLLDLVSTPNLLDLVSTPNLLDLVSTANLLGLVSTPNLLDLVSTPNLLDLVSTPNLLDLVSTPNLLNLVSTPNLLDLVSTPNLLDLVSTANLLDLVSTPNLLDLVSTANLLDLVSTSFLEETLISTVIGLGTIGYISTQSGGIASIPDYISTIWISAGSVELSSLIIKDPNFPEIFDSFITNENGNLIYKALQTHIFLSNGSSNTTQITARSYAIGGVEDGNILYAYLLGSDPAYTGTFSTPTFVDIFTNRVTALYLSSIYIGNTGGTFAGEITTDDTATNLFWNGSQLNNQSGGGDVPFLSSFTLSTTEIFTSSIGGNEGTLFLNGDILDLRGVQITDSLTNTITFSNAANRIDFANNLLSSSAFTIQTRNPLLLGSTTQINIYVGNPNPDSIIVQDFDQSVFVGVNSNLFDSNALCVGDRGDIYVAGGNLDSLGNTLAYSSDGYRWEGAGCNYLDVRVNAFSFNIFSGQLAAVGKNSTDSYTLIESFDGINWQDVFPQPPFTEGRCIANNGGFWVMGGSGPTDTLAYGNNYFNLVGAGCNVFDDFVAGVAFGLDKWVAVGASATTGNTIAYSYDGINWIGIGNTIFDVAGLCVAFNGTYWIAGGVGTTNTIAYSDDGIHWNGGGILFTESTISLAWRTDQFQWFAGGSGGATLFAGDSNFWNDLTGNVTTTSQINGIVARQQINTSFQMFANGAIGTLSFFVGGISFLNGITSMNYDFKNSVSQFYVDPNVRKIGIECNTPVRNLDVNGDGYFTTLSTLMVDSDEGYFRSTISTHSLVVYGPSTFIVEGVSFFKNFISAPYAVLNSLSLIDSVTQDVGVIRLENGSLVTPGGGGISQTTLNSTLEGLGSLGYVSSVQLLDLVSTPNLLDLVSSPNLLDLVSTANLLDLVSTPNLLGLLSTANLLDLVSTPNLLDLVSTANLIGLLSTANLLDLVSTPNLVDLVSTPNLLDLVSTPNLLNMVSTPNLVDLVSTTNLLDLVSTPNLLDLVSTPNLLGLLSTANLLDLVSTPNLLNLVSTPNLLNLISTPNMTGLVSTANLLNLVSTTFLNTSLQSTTLGLATSGYISTTQLTSTVRGLGSAGFISSASLLNLVSTQNLLNLVSTQNLLNLVSTTFLNTTLASTGTSYQNTLSTLRVQASSIAIGCNVAGTALQVATGLPATTAFNLGTVTIDRPGALRNNVSAVASTNALVIFCGQTATNGDGGAISFDHSFNGNFAQSRGSRIASICDTGTFGQSVGLTFATGQNTITERMRISGSGRVGIGCNNPATLLDIDGITRTSSLQVNGSPGTLNPILGVNQPTSVTFSMNEFANHGIVIRNAGATNTCFIMGADNQSNVSYLQSIHIGVTQRPLLLNPQGGNVGVGCNNPQFRLDVNGSICGQSLSTLQIQTSSIQNSFIIFNDITTAGASSNLYMSTNYLLYGNNVIGGARQAQAQTITF